MKRTIFLINGSLKNKYKILSEIKNTFPVAVLETSQSAEHLLTLAKLAVKTEFRNLIVVGGDGSVNEVLNGIMHGLKVDEMPDLSALSQLTLGILPWGTGNDFCRTLSCTKDLASLKNKIYRKQFKPIDVGRARFKDKMGKPVLRYFLNITDIGMGGVVVAGMEKTPKWIPRQLGYPLQIVKTLLTYKKSQVEVSDGVRKFRGLVTNVIAANGRYFGNGLGIAPDADPADGLFEWVTLGNINILDYIKHLSTIKKAVKVVHPEVSYKRAGKLTIKSIDGRALPVDMDGEFVGYGPMEIDILPGVLNIYA